MMAGKREHMLGLAIRRALIMILSALEDYLEIERSIAKRMR